jgi:hypothetical protein
VLLDILTLTLVIRRLSICREEKTMSRFNPPTRTTWTLYGVFGIASIVCIGSIGVGITNIHSRSLLFFGIFGLVMLIVGVRSYIVKQL